MLRRWPIVFSGIALSFVYLLGLAGCNDISSVSTPPPEPPGPGPLAIPTAALNIGITGQQYTDVVSGTGGTTPYAWSVTPSLPPNLQLNATTGTITGIPSGTSNLSHTFTLRDSSSPPVQVQKILPLSIVTAPPVLTILTTTLPPGTINQPYSETLQAAGGTGTLTWSLVGGSLPQNFNLNPSTGAISGTPTGSAANTSNFTVQVADAGGQLDTQGLSITINLPPSPTITTSSLPGGTVGVPYSQAVQATGGTGPLTWSASGNLPPSLSINPNTGLIAGTPTAPGPFNFTVQVTDSLTLSDTQALSITIAPVPVPPTITTPSLPGGTVGSPYSQTLQASGGTGTLVWSRTNGSLPANVSLSSDGTISGTPTNTGTANFTVRVVDALSQSATKDFSITVSAAVPVLPPLSITTNSLPEGRRNQNYSATLQASGGTPSYTWSVTPGLPGGLTLNSSTGTISGRPTTSSNNSYTFTVRDSNNQTATKQLNLRIRNDDD